VHWLVLSVQQIGLLAWDWSLAILSIKHEASDRQPLGVQGGGCALDEPMTRQGTWRFGGAEYSGSNASITPREEVFG